MKTETVNLILRNPNCNPVEFDGIRIQVGRNSFTLTPKQWIEKTFARQYPMIVNQTQSRP